MEALVNLGTQQPYFSMYIALHLHPESDMPFFRHLSENEFTEIPPDFLNIPHLNSMYVSIYCYNCQFNLSMYTSRYLDSNQIERIHPAAFRLQPEMTKMQG